AVTPAGKEQKESELLTEDLATQNLLQQFNKLKKQLEQQRSAAKAQAQTQRRDEEWLTVPQPGAGKAGSKRTPAAGNPHGGNAGPPAAADAGSTAPPLIGPAPAVEVRVVANLDPVRGQIHGSQDHGRVAQALFRAGQALMDKAEELRQHGQTTGADELDAQAKERLVRALDALKAVTVANDTPFADLFCLGRCREALFRLAERHEELNLRDNPKEFQRREQDVRDPFVAITARDAHGQKGVEVLGLWGRAAQTAMEHFRWMNLHAGFQPKVPLESITWLPDPPK
ncbi:MAG TPA: hypothetical protein VK348_02360, partial [Planctomycetota bacterium]|nr:hypothetical protein [Planctomycetota bacterium]